MAKQLKEEKLVSTSKKNLPLASLSDLRNSCENCYNKDFTPEHLDFLDLENVVVDMIRNYKKNQYQNITAPGSMPPVTDDARSVHFSLKKLKSFIYYIENTICDRKSKCNTVLGELGIRFYYAAYDQTMSTGSGIHPYAGKHTLVLVPTYTKDFEDGNPPQNVDLCPDWFINEDGCEPEDLEQGGATYGGGATIQQGASQMRLASNGSKKIIALVGGYGDIEKKIQVDNTKNIAKPQTTKAKKGKGLPKTAMAARPDDGVDPGDGGIVHTLLNHGDLMPPPSITSITRYRDATLLNC
jgi:hypothetical protein